MIPPQDRSSRASGSCMSLISPRPKGNHLPEPPNWKSPEQNAILSQRLIDFAKQKGISVTVKKLDGNTQGLSRGGEIELDPSAGTKTLIHEIAHELLHQDENRPMDKTIRELEAESVAYVVGKHFGLDGLSSPNYVALHGATSEMILDHLERIRKAAGEIINMTCDKYFRITNPRQIYFKVLTGSVIYQSVL